MNEPLDRPRLDRLVLKPTLACTADCHFCNSRRSLHRSLIRSKMVSLDRWKEILKEAKQLGAVYFVISGGEPTLYRYLIELVKSGKQNGLIVTVNSNGSLLKEPLIKRLLDAGLDSVCISIHSHKAEVHDTMKCEKGVWEKASQAVKIFSRLTQGNPRFSLQTQTVISRENFETFDELMAFHYGLGSSVLRLSYLEGDFHHQYLLTPEQIKKFRQEIIPKALRVCEKIEPSLRPDVEKVIRRLYSDEIATPEEFAAGIYQPSRRNLPKCRIPSYQALILANGDVHPCNVVEYSHEPVVGNVMRNSLTEIWTGDNWAQFRANPFEFCQYCPMNVHDDLLLRKKPLTVTQKARRFARKVRDLVLKPHVPPQR